MLNFYINITFSISQKGTVLLYDVDVETLILSRFYKKILTFQKIEDKKSAFIEDTFDNCDTVTYYRMDKCK